MSKAKTTGATIATTASAQEITTKGGEKLYKVETEKEIDELYKHYQILSDAGENASSHVDSYKYILNAVRGGSERVKILACQFIPKFFKYFDKLASQAINAQIDLCEEESRNIRLNAIKGLPLICQDKKENVGNISSVIGQLLVEEDKIELDTVKNAFLQLFRIDTMAAMTTLFQQIESQEQEDEKAREQAIAFLKERIMPLASELIHPNPDVEKFISNEIQKLLGTASQKEFADYLTILQKLSMYHDSNGKKLLLDMIVQQSPLTSNQEFDPKDVDTLKKVLHLMHVAAPLFRASHQTGPFFQFLINKVLPRINELEDKLRLEVLQGISVGSVTASADDARVALPVIYQRLKDSIKLKDKESDPDPELNFSYLECYLYTFHQLAQKVPGSLNAICGIRIVTGQPQDDMGDYSEKREDMIKRLQYLEQRCKRYKDALIQLSKATAASSSSTTATESSDNKDEGKSENGDEQKNKDEQQQQPTKPSIDMEQAEITKRVINNLLRMSSTLSKQKPAFIKFNDISVSWVERQGRKRSSSAADLPDQPSEKRQRQSLYQPPNKRGGNSNRKQHHTVDFYHQNSSGGKRGGGRGGFSRGGRGGRGSRGSSRGGRGGRK